MSLVVAIAAESDAYDSQIYKRLLGMVLDTDVTSWTGGMIFNGNRAVAKLAPVFLSAASNAGIRHALLAVDNDGGGHRRQEHRHTCIVSTFDINDDVGCRECWLEAAAPPRWRASGGQLSVAVPVQTLETWLLALRGTVLNSPTPEQYYNRSALKSAFFGRPKPDLEGRIALARDLLDQPTALQTLEQRSSFRRFRDQVIRWTIP